MSPNNPTAALHSEADVVAWWDGQILQPVCYALYRAREVKGKPSFGTISEFFAPASKPETPPANEPSDAPERIPDCASKPDKVIRYDTDNLDAMELIGFIEFEKRGVIRAEEFRTAVF